MIKANEKITEEEILKFIEERVAPHKTLRGGVEFIDKIPRSLSGKILRRELKARVMAELKTMKEDRNSEEEKNVIRSKNPDVEIPDSLSWTEFIFQNFDQYEDREAIVSLLYGTIVDLIRLPCNRFYKKRHMIQFDTKDLRSIAALQNHASFKI